MGKIRDEIDKILRDICDKCFENRPFKAVQTNDIIDFIGKQYGDELEFLWPNFPTDAIWRRKDNRKWYGLLMAVQRKKLGIDGEEIVEVLNVRVEPEEMKNVVDNKGIFVGYHMNKKHWISICLDGSVDMLKIKKLIENSYNLAKK